MKRILEKGGRCQGEKVWCHLSVMEGGWRSGGGRCQGEKEWCHLSGMEGGWRRGGGRALLG